MRTRREVDEDEKGNGHVEVPGDRRLHPRPPRVRAALARLAHRRQLGGVPPRLAEAPHEDPGHRLRPGHHHRRPGGAGSRRPCHRRRPRAGNPGPGPRHRRRTRPGQRRVRGRGRARAGLSGRHVLRGPRPPGAPARGRPGPGAARDVPGDQAGRVHRRPRRGLRSDDLVSRGAGHDRLAGPVCARRPRQRGEPAAGRRLKSWALAAGIRDITATSSTWTFATEDERDWWGGLWADRTLASAYADRATEGGHANAEQLRAVSDAWREWARQEDGWFSVLHGEILCRKDA